MTDIQELSEREIEILSLVATGVSNKEIAYQLKISTNTVKVHLRNIFEKINVTSRTEAALYAVKHGLVPISAISPGLPTMTQENTRQAELGDQPRVYQARINLGKQRVRYFTISIMIIVLGLLSAWYFIEYFNRRSLVRFTNESELNRWTKLTALTESRKDFALVNSGNKIYAIGGSKGDGVIGTVEVYNTNRNEWMKMASKPSPVSEIQGAVVGGLIYIPGGLSSSGVVLNNLEIYDPEINHWRQGSPLPEPRSAYAFTAFEGKLYLFGGWDGEKFVQNGFVYDPNLDQWASLPDMTERRGFAGAAVSGGKIYIFGGKNEAGILSSTAVFSPSPVDYKQGTWSNTVPMPEGRFGFGAANLADIIFIAGGEGRRNKCLPGWVFYPEKKEWQSFQITEYPACSGLGLTSAGTDIFLAGGINGGEVTNQFVSFQAIYTALLPLVPQR